MKIVCDRKGKAFTLTFDADSDAEIYRKKSQTFGSPEAAAEAVKQFLIKKWSA